MEVCSRCHTQIHTKKKEELLKYYPINKKSDVVGVIINGKKGKKNPKCCPKCKRYDYL